MEVNDEIAPNSPPEHTTSHSEMRASNDYEKSSIDPESQRIAARKARRKDFPAWKDVRIDDLTNVWLQLERCELEVRRFEQELVEWPAKLAFFTDFAEQFVPKSSEFPTHRAGDDDDRARQFWCGLRVLPTLAEWSRKELDEAAARLEGVGRMVPAKATEFLKHIQFDLRVKHSRLGCIIGRMRDIITAVRTLHARDEKWWYDCERVATFVLSKFRSCFYPYSHVGTSKFRNSFRPIWEPPGLRRVASDGHESRARLRRDAASRANVAITPNIQRRNRDERIAKGKTRVAGETPERVKQHPQFKAKRRPGSERKSRSGQKVVSEWSPWSEMKVRSLRTLRSHFKPKSKRKSNPKHKTHPKRL